MEDPRPPLWPWWFVLLGWLCGEARCRVHADPARPIPRCAPLGEGAVPTAPGPAFWRAAPGLGRARGARVARAAWRSGLDVVCAPGGAAMALEDPDLAARTGAWLETLEGIGPLTAARVLDWLRGPGQAVHCGIRCP